MLLAALCKIKPLNDRAPTPLPHLARNSNLSTLLGALWKGMRTLGGTPQQDERKAAGPLRSRGAPRDPWLLEGGWNEGGRWHLERGHLTNLLNSPQTFSLQSTQPTKREQQTQVWQQLPIGAISGKRRAPYRLFRIWKGFPRRRKTRRKRSGSLRRRNLNDDVTAYVYDVIVVFKIGNM